MIEVKNLFKSFEDNHVLKGISATFNQGDTSLIIGSSGSGKTVFLKCLLGLFEPDQGDIFYDGRSYIEMDISKKRELRKEMGMVFQSGALFDS
ncbi:MAG: ATP-binding cassette domain-containing protein, partial [Lutimonas sp.]